MDIRAFRDQLPQYRHLYLLWTGATALIVLAHFALPVSLTLGFGLLALGALNLGAAGVSCAYTLAHTAG